MDLTSFLMGRITGGNGGGSSGEAPENDVQFLDYDGTIVYSYSKAEFLALTAMPANPTHDGLTAQGWNWTLADAQAYVQDYGMLDIGQMYITDDGKTRIYISLVSDARLSPTIYWYHILESDVTIDWGDGSAMETFTGSGNKNATHTYTAIGDYMITMTVSEGGSIRLGGSASLFGSISNHENGAYQTSLRKVEIGNGVTAFGSNGVFYYAYRLESITISSAINNFGSSAFAYCYSLKGLTIPNVTSINIGSDTVYICNSIRYISIPNTINKTLDRFINNNSSIQRLCIPNNVTKIGNGAVGYNKSCYRIIVPSSVTQFGNNPFNYCEALMLINIPDGITTLTNSVFSSCYSIQKFVIPQSVTRIEYQAFAYCYCVGVYDFTSSVAIPTLVGTNAFQGIPADCKIVVPDSLYESWIVASNWASYASYIVKESEYNA